MLAGPVRRIGAAARRGLAAPRRGLTAPGDAAARRLAKTVDEKPGAGWTPGQLWLFNQLNELEARSSKRLHALHLQHMEIEKELNAMTGKIMVYKANIKRTVEMTERAVLTMGTIGICAMHLLLRE